MNHDEDPRESFATSPGEILPMPKERDHLYRFPFPLRDDLDVSLALPRNLTADEAERLAVFIRTLALPAADAPPPETPTTRVLAERADRRTT